MTILDLFRILHMICYLVVVSQLLFYFTVMGDALKKGSIENFLELRKIIDTVMVNRIKIPYYSSLFLSFVLVLLTFQHPQSYVFITGTIAFICLLIDAFIAIKFNVPLNKLTNQWPEKSTDVNWMEVRILWLKYINYRAIFTTFGMISLFAGAVLSGN